MDTQQENQAAAEPRLYYLRTADEQQYGPADLETIRLWCREGRIGPDQQVSTDQQDWLPVTEEPALEFDWLLVLEDGTEAGPFHLAMLEEELATGNLPTGVTFKHRVTQEIRHPQAPRQPAPPSEIDTQEPAESLQEDETVAQTTEETETTSTAPPTEEAETTATDPVDDEPVSLRLEMLARHAADAREQLAETRSILQHLRTQYTLLQDQNQHLQERVTGAESERDTAEQNLLDMQNHAAQNAAELDNLRAQLAQMQEHYETLQLENQHQFEQIDDLRAAALTAEQTFKRELSVIQTRLEAKSRIVDEVAEIILQDAPNIPQTNATRSVQSPPPLAAAPRQAAQSPAAPESTLAQQPTPPAKPRRPMVAPPEKPYPRLTWGIPAAILLMALLLFLVGFGIVAAVSAWRSRSASTVPHQTTPSVPTDTIEETAVPAVPEDALVLQPERSNQRATRNNQPTVPRNWPALDLPGTVILQEENAMRITFDEGVFISGTRLHDASRQNLLRLARQLSKQLGTFSVIVEGHTDTIPVRPDNEQFIDNFSLGLARAEIVKHFLAEEGGLPAARIHTASAGQSSPPYPNDTAENRARNRTVVLSIIP